MWLDSFLLAIFIFLIVWDLLPIIICYSMAKRKGKSRVLWVLLAAIFGWLAVLFIAIAAPER